MMNHSKKDAMSQIMLDTHYVKSVRIRSYSGPHFSASYSVSLRIQSECGKMQARITANTDTFYAVTINIFFLTF